MMSAQAPFMAVRSNGPSTDHDHEALTSRAGGVASKRR